MKKTILTFLILMSVMLSYGQQPYDKVFKYGDYRQSWVLVVKDELYGFIDSTEKEIVMPKYERIGKGDKIEGIINGIKEEIKR